MRLVARRTLRRLKRESGAVILETVIAFAICLPMLFGLFDVCRLMYSCSLAVYAGEAGLHYACVHGTNAGEDACSGPGCVDSSGQNVIHVVNQSLSNGLLGSATDNKATTKLVWENSSLTATANAPTPGSIVQLDMTVPFKSYLLPQSLTTFHFDFRGHIEY